MPWRKSVRPAGRQPFTTKPDAMPADQFVRIERDGKLAVVTIDRPRKLNALDSDVVRQLSDAFRELRGSDVRGVILTGAGSKAFVAGADIGELATMDPRSGMLASRAGQEAFRRIETCGAPVLAAVNGFALGGGCELALACHLRIASRNASFGLPEAGLGIIPGYGGTMRLARIVGMGRAIEMILTGDRITAERALEIGLVSSVHDQARLMEAAKALMGRIVENAPVAVRFALEAVRRSFDSSARDALAFESSLFGVLAGTRDMKEGMAAFLERRRADFEGR